MEEFSQIYIEENDGISTIKIDGTIIKGLAGYIVKRDVDNVLVTLNIVVPPKNLKTIY